MRWLQAAGKPARPHWRTGAPPGEGGEPGTVNAVTGRKSPGRGFAPATALHCESVARAFYDHHLEAGTGPMVNPFPLARAGRGHDLVWGTLRRAFRPLSYRAARAMFGRAKESLGANWSLHDLRHTAAYRMARDPLMPLTDVISSPHLGVLAVAAAGVLCAFCCV